MMKQIFTNLLTGLCLLYLGTKPSFCQTIKNLGGWQTDGRVKTIAEDVNYIYLGGSFSALVKLGTAGALTHGIPVSTTGAGEVVQGFPNVNGNVYITISDGSGGWYIGGIFTHVGGIDRNNIAHINPDKTLDLIWNPNAIGGSLPGVRALALSGTDLYVGGDFTHIGGQPRSNIAKLSTTGAGNADATWNPNANNTIYTLTLSGTDLYVGGWFSTLGGQPRNRIAKLSTTGAGNVDETWNPNASGGGVSALALSGTDLYVGGVYHHWRAGKKLYCQTQHHGYRCS
ncbi:MAG TPA: hypothetical protein DCM08_07115 [Microscillaceae bacterium]|jgi:hypothetical protein|nr:hypothetical protein [Microscillaceae bacterium]